VKKQLAEIEAHNDRIEKLETEARRPAAKFGSEWDAAHPRPWPEGLKAIKEEWIRRSTCSGCGLVVEQIVPINKTPGLPADWAPAMGTYGGPNVCPSCHAGYEPQRQALADWRKRRDMWVGAVYRKAAGQLPARRFYELPARWRRPKA
jgi:hypothetical protein